MAGEFEGLAKNLLLETAAIKLGLPYVVVEAKREFAVGHVARLKAVAKMLGQRPDILGDRGDIRTFLAEQDALKRDEKPVGTGKPQVSGNAATVW
jgi:hypothetical protein